MRSSRPKVLHAIGSRPLVAHVLTAVREAGGESAVVIGPSHEAVAAAVKSAAPDAAVFVQSERRGTAHAVLAARTAIARGYDELLVVFADTPLIRPATLARLRATLDDKVAVAVLGFRPAERTGYGRLITAGTRLLAIREEKDASDAEKAITLCNAGLMALKGDIALAILDRIGSDNAKGEFYLTDAVAIARKMGLETVALEAEEDEVRGINTQAQLADAEAVLQRRLRSAALEAGVTMVAPDTVHLSADTKLAADVTIEPYVIFGPGVTVAAGATIRSFSHLEGAEVGAGAIVGPYARLRPGARLAEKVHVGNFVEVKASDIGTGSKANHLAYIGDTSIGAGANIGAGTITCNYDGFNKHKTEIGDRAFIGSNSSLVAPVRIGAGAYVGSGSVITEEVPVNALAIGRGRQVVKEGFGARLRERNSGIKKDPA